MVTCFFLFKNKADKNQCPFEVGDWVTTNGKYPHLEPNFIRPKKVVSVKTGPEYAGGWLVYVGQFEGYYSNGLKHA